MNRQIQIMIKLYSIVTLIVLSLALKNNYTLSNKSIVFDPIYEKVAFSPDQKIIITYSPSTKYVFTYFGRTFTQPSKYESSFYPSHIEIFSTKDCNYVLYGGTEGDLFMSIVANQKIEQKLMPYVKINGSVRDIAFSSTQQYVAVASSDKNVYIINGVAVDKIIDTISVQNDIYAVDWDPSTDVLVIASGTLKNITQNKLILYDIKTKTKSQLIIRQKFPTDAKFSPDGKFIVRTSVGSNFVYIHSRQNLSQIDYLFAKGATSLASICISENTKYVSALDQETGYMFVWEFNGQVLVKLTTNLKGGAMASNGGSILVKNDQNLFLFKLCDDLSTYNPSKDVCIACNSTCSQCWQTSYFCLRCSNGFFIDQVQHNCTSCLSKCQLCDDHNTCRGCSTGYYLVQYKQCINCAISQPGCSKCDNPNNCFECQTGLHWLMNSTTHKCECQSSYVAVKGQPACASCPNDCIKCDQPTKCLTCSVKMHRNVTPLNGACICQNYFYDNNNKCDSCGFGCKTCQHTLFCDSCDKESHFVQNILGKCQCEDGYVNYTLNAYFSQLISSNYNQPYCELCSNILIGCKICSSATICLVCLDGFMNGNTPNSCVCPSNTKVSSDNRSCESQSDQFLTILIFVIGGLVLVSIVAYVMFRWEKKKRTRFSTMIEEESPQNLNYSTANSRIQ